jgi:hypothetical protein
MEPLAPPLPDDVIKKYLEIIDMSGDELAEYRDLLAKKSHSMLAKIDKARLTELTEKFTGTCS